MDSVGLGNQWESKILKELTQEKRYEKYKLPCKICKYYIYDEESQPYANTCTFDGTALPIMPLPRVCEEFRLEGWALIDFLFDEVLK